MSELVKLNDEQNTLATTLDSLAESGLTCRDMKQGFRKALMTASCIKQLGEALTPQVMEPIMALQGSSLGFRTDKDSQGGYPLNVVKEALIAAVMVGLMPCGNHFNVISSRMYVTKEGFTYLLDQAGVKYTIDQEVPQVRSDGKEAMVVTNVSWNYDGNEGKKELKIPVRVNSGMGADAILGKADRKAKCWLYNNLLHAQLSDGDAEGAAPMRDVTPERGSTSQASPMKASPMRAAAARVVEAEPVVAGSSEKPSAVGAYQDNSVVAPERNFAALLNDLRDAGKSWEPFKAWLEKKGVQLPPAGNAAKHDLLAAWVYSQAPLLSEMISEGWIIRGE